MKKIYYLIFLAIGISGCSVESIDSTEVLFTADAKVKLTEVQNFIVPTEICAGVEATFSIEAAVGSNLQVQQLIAGDWVQVYHSNSSTANPQNFNLLFEEAGDYSLRYKIGSGGFTQKSVSVLNCTACEESFSYVSSGENTYTFNYTPAEDMEDAIVVFTFAQSVAISGLETWTTNGVTMQNNMDLNACQEYSWTLTLIKNCSGNSPNSNVWTDFKVNDISKKNNLSNIVQNCN